jgi:superfamily II DNA or RNA helicase
MHYGGVRSKLTVYIRGKILTKFIGRDTIKTKNIYKEKVEKMHNYTQVEQLIGDEYREWKDGSNVLICTGTGSGKTTFVKKQLLQYAIEQNKAIVYYCNRRCLRDQNEENFSQYILNQFDIEVIDSTSDTLNNPLKHIYISTYQAAEQFPDPKDAGKMKSLFQIKQEQVNELELKKSKQQKSKKTSVAKRKYNKIAKEEYSEELSIEIIDELNKSTSFFKYGYEHLGETEPTIQLSTEEKEYYRDRINRIYLLPDDDTCVMSESEHDDARRWYNSFNKVIMRSDNIDSKTDDSKIIEPPLDILYYVFDEAHYFVSDAIINAETDKWEKLRYDKRGINVFLTATPEPLFCFFGEYFWARYNNLFDKCEEYYIRLGEISKEMDNPVLSAKKEMALDYKREYCEINGKKVLLDRPARLILCCDIQLMMREKKYDNRYSKMFEYVQELLRYGKEAFDYVYGDNTRADHYQTKYFSSFEDLEMLIQNNIEKTDDKWLIFVDSLDSGKKLEDDLKKVIKESDVVFLNAKDYSSKKKGKQETYERIIKTSSFPCRILIATSFLDCGINLIDEELRHIVLAAHNKTSFLQMLGRVRLQPENTKIQLYIKAYTKTEISGHARKCFTILNNMIRFTYLDQMYSLETNHSKRSLVFYNEYLTFVKEGIKKDGKYGFLQARVQDAFPAGDTKPQEFVIKVVFNRFAGIHYLYLLYYYHYLQSGLFRSDPNYFLKVQLAWLGKSYDEEDWVSDRIEILKKYLEGLCQSGEYLQKDEQSAFRRKCFMYLKNNSKVSKNIYDNIGKDRASKEETPGKKKLNMFFKCLQIPYTIESKMISDKSKRITVWYIVRA